MTQQYVKYCLFYHYLFKKSRNIVFSPVMRVVTGGFDPRVFDKIKRFEYLEDLLYKKT